MIYANDIHTRKTEQRKQHLRVRGAHEHARRIDAEEQRRPVGHLSVPQHVAAKLEQHVSGAGEGAEVDEHRRQHQDASQVHDELQI